MPTPRIHTDSENQIHFITCTVIEWIDIFTKPVYFQVITDSLKYCRKNKRLQIYEYVIMTNHIHLICQAKDGYKLSQIISDFKKHTTREILKLLKIDNRKYITRLLTKSYSKKHGYQNQLWQRENYPELVISEKFLLTKATYIHNNPAKKGYVKNPEDWLYSSARNRILNDHSILELDTW